MSSRDAIGATSIIKECDRVLLLLLLQRQIAVASTSATCASATADADADAATVVLLLGSHHHLVSPGRGFPRSANR